MAYDSTLQGNRGGGYPAYPSESSYGRARDTNIKQDALRALADFVFTQHRLVVSNAERIRFARFSSSYDELLQARLIRATIPRTVELDDVAAAIANIDKRSFTRWITVWAQYQLTKNAEILRTALSESRCLLIQSETDYAAFSNLFRSAGIEQGKNYSVVVISSSEENHRQGAVPRRAADASGEPFKGFRD